MVAPRTTSLPPGRNTPAISRKAASRSATLRSPKETVAPAKWRSGKGSARASAASAPGRGAAVFANLWRGEARRGGGENAPAAPCAPPGAPPGGGGRLTARPAAEVEHGGVRRQIQSRRRPPAPDHVQAGGE